MIRDSGAMCAEFSRKESETQKQSVLWYNSKPDIYNQEMSQGMWYLWVLLKKKTSWWWNQVYQEVGIKKIKNGKGDMKWVVAIIQYGCNRIKTHCNESLPMK